MTKMKKAAIYLRVSTNEQDSSNQLPSLLAYAKARGYEVVSVYEENGSAWRAGHQPRLADLLEAVRSGRVKYDILLTWALDRLSREGSQRILELVDTFKTYGVKVISLQESWTESPGMAGEVLFAIAGWVARMESERRSERTKEGQARVLRKGETSKGRKLTQLGRPQGSKDKGKRRRAGYLNRYLKGKEAVRSE